MSKAVTLVVPEAPAPKAAAAERTREIRPGGIRLGILDNSKGNADHLLRFVVEGVKAALPVDSVVSLRKPAVTMPAEAAMIDQLVREADFVVSAMAD